MSSLLPEGEISRSISSPVKTSGYIPITIKAFLQGVTRTPRVSLRTRRCRQSRAASGIHSNSIHSEYTSPRSNDGPDLVDSAPPPGGKRRTTVNKKRRRECESVSTISNSYPETARSIPQNSPKNSRPTDPTPLRRHEGSTSSEQSIPLELAKTAKNPIQTYSKKREYAATSKATYRGTKNARGELPINDQLERQTAEESYCTNGSSSLRKQLIGLVENKEHKRSRDCQVLNGGDNEQSQKSRRKRRLPLNELALVKSIKGAAPSPSSNDNPQLVQSRQTLDMDQADCSHKPYIDTTTKSKASLPEGPGAQTAAHTPNTIRRPLTAIRKNIRVGKRPDKLSIDISEFKVPSKIQSGARPRLRRSRVGSGFDAWNLKHPLPPPRLKVAMPKLKQSGGLVGAENGSTLYKALPVRNPVNKADIQVAVPVHPGSCHVVEQAKSVVYMNGPNPPSGSQLNLNTCNDESVFIAEGQQIRQLHENNPLRRGVISDAGISDTGQLARISVLERPQALFNLQSYGHNEMNSGLEPGHSSARLHAADHDMRGGARRRVTFDEEVYRQFERVTAPTRPVANGSEIEDELVSERSDSSGLDTGYVTDVNSDSTELLSFAERAESLLLEEPEFVHRVMDEPDLPSQHFTENETNLLGRHGVAVGFSGHDSFEPWITTSDEHGKNTRIETHEDPMDLSNSSASLQRTPSNLITIYEPLSQLALSYPRSFVETPMRLACSPELGCTRTRAPRGFEIPETQDVAGR